MLMSRSDVASEGLFGSVRRSVLGESLGESERFRYEAEVCVRQNFLNILA